MKATSAIAKGKLLEEYVAKQIREKGIDPKAVRSHGSGSTNTEKSDIWTSMQILGVNAGIECKNHKVIKLQDWWRQTKKLESLNREPVLVFKIDQEPLEATKVVIYLDTLLELVANQGGDVKEDYQDPAAKYAFRNLKKAVRVAMKYIE